MGASKTRLTQEKHHDQGNSEESSHKMTSELSLKKVKVERK